MIARNHRRARKGTAAARRRGRDRAGDRWPSAIRTSTSLRARWPEGRKFELDELIIRPGTYFNPQTEVLVIVDDSPELDAEIFNMEQYEGADWVLISDEVPVDEHGRDELLESFQAEAQPLPPNDEDVAEEDEEFEADQED